MVPDDGPLQGVEEVGAPLAVLPGLRVLVQGDPGPVGQEPYGVDEVEMLGGPDEGDGVTRGLAAEAVVEPLLGVDAERRALLGVERAQAGPAAADPLERGVLADEGDDVGCRPHLGHILVRYRHWMTVPRRCVRSGRPTPAGPARQLALRAFGAVLTGAGGSAASTAWAAANRATGTRNGEQLT